MSDTRQLLGKISDLRLRLAQAHSSPTPDVLAPTEIGSAAHRQSVLNASLRPLTAEPPETSARPSRLVNSVRVQIERGRNLIAKLRELADDPELSLSDSTHIDPDDPLVGNFRETSAMTESALRLVQAFPDSPTAQIRLGEGLESILNAIDDRIGTLQDAIAGRTGEHDKRDRLADLLQQLASGEVHNPTPFAEIAGEILHEVRSGASLRFAHSHPKQVSKFVASHSITCARIAARMIRHDAEWQRQAIEAVVAALLKDVGMLAVPGEILETTGPLNDSQRREIEHHARLGAELVARHLPTRASICEAIVSHHERLDGTGYPAGLREAQIGAVPRLLALADVYAALCQPRPFRAALDPRTALTETLMLAERGQMDRDLAHRLLQLSFYPVGTVVELADGAVAVVVATHAGPPNTQTTARPVVALLIDENGRFLPTPKHLDLAECESRNIVRSLTAAQRKELLGKRYPDLI